METGRQFPRTAAAMAASSGILDANHKGQPVASPLLGARAGVSKASFTPEKALGCGTSLARLTIRDADRRTASTICSK